MSTHSEELWGGRRKLSSQKCYGDYLITWPDNTNCGGGLWGHAPVWAIQNNSKNALKIEEID